MGTSTVFYSYLKQGVDNWMVHGIHHDAPRFRRALSDVSKKKLHFFTVGNDEVAFPQISCPRIFMLFIDIGPRAKPWQRLAIKQISKNLILVSLFRNKKQENWTNRFETVGSLPISGFSGFQRLWKCSLSAEKKNFTNFVIFPCEILESSRHSTRIWPRA